tara:strand:- start:1481 stop:1786 length:306 start_codon:yes stop_codon:yes gene_type:complete
MKVCEQLRHIMHAIHQNLKDDQPMIDKASATTYTSGALTALWGFVTSQQFGILAGVLIGLAGLMVNYLHKQKDLAFKAADERRKQELHEITIRQMGEKSQD